MLTVYNILYIILAICYLPFFLIRRKCHRGFLMRLGIFPQSAINKIKGQKVIWLHTVSVGEVVACRTLVKDLEREYPDFRLIISTVTKTGNKVAANLINSGNLAIYSPLDIGFIVKKVINLINPQLFIIAETEIWPNLVTALAKKNIPVALVNGRISSTSFRGYKSIYLFLRNILKNFSLFCMQAKEDAQRIIELGADKARVVVTGNMKFDVQTQNADLETADLALSKNEQLFIAGSTHRGEERIILQVYKDLIKDYPDLRLLIAPRHIERAQEVERLISGFGFKSQRVSQLNLNLRPTSYVLRPILILDTVGQLRSLYALAEIVFIGGSLIHHGGQNPIEAACYSKPILFGPHMFNFSSIAGSFLNKNAAIMVKDTQHLKDVCVKLLDRPICRSQLGARAKETIQQNQGATLRNLELIRQFITTASNKGGSNES